MWAPLALLTTGLLIESDEYYVFVLTTTITPARASTHMAVRPDPTFWLCEPDQLRELSILLSNKTRSKKFQYFWSKMSQKCTSFIAILIFSYVSEPPRLLDSGTCLLAYFFGITFSNRTTALIDDHVLTSLQVWLMNV